MDVNLSDKLYQGVKKHSPEMSYIPKLCINFGQFIKESAFNILFNSPRMIKLYNSIDTIFFLFFIIWQLNMSTIVANVLL